MGFSHIGLKQESHLEKINQICNGLGINLTSKWLFVSVEEQRMYYYLNNILEVVYMISTAQKGVSQIQNSEGTPLGLHKIADKIGDKVHWGTVFIGRQNTGKVFTNFEDWKIKGYVTSRILRLMGLQEGYNAGKNCDTYDRYIYIHGIANEEKIGIPWTRGCIGMRNDDVIELFQKIDLNSLILLHK